MLDTFLGLKHIALPLLFVCTYCRFFLDIRSDIYIEQIKRNQNKK